MAKSGLFHTQLTTIMDIMTKTALAQICRLFEEDSAALRREMSKVMRENKLLHDQLRCLQYELTRVVGPGKKGPHKRAKLHHSMGIPTGETYRGVDKDNMGITRAPSINGIFGKEWCMNLWNDGEAKGCTPADAESHSGFVEEIRGDDQEQIELLTIKEEESEVDINERTQHISEDFTKEGGRWVSDRSETSSTDRHYTDVVRRGGGGGHSFSVDSSEDFENFLESSGMLGGHNTEFISLDGTSGDYTILPPPAVSPTYDPHCEPIEYEYEGMEGETQLVAFEGLSEIPSPLPRVVKSEPAIKTESVETFGYFNRFELRPPPKKRRFHCKICGKTYVKYDTLKTHMRVHKREKFYRCRICKSVFPQKNLLRTHKCTVVPSSSSNNNNKDKNKDKDKETVRTMSNNTVQIDVKDHVRKYTVQQNNKPKGKKNKNKHKVKETVRTMSNNTVQIDDKDHVRKYAVQQNKKNKEPVRTMSNHTVQIDDKDHVRKYTVQQNSSKPNKGKNSCEYCGRCFTTLTNLRVHYSVHTGERPHKCDICGKTFTQKGNMNIHRRIHTGEKPFACPVCHKCFSQKVNLRQHVVTHGQKYALKKGKRYVVKMEPTEEPTTSDV